VTWLTHSAIGTCDALAAHSRFAFCFVHWLVTGDLPF
jgi:hypothetical protein